MLVLTRKKSQLIQIGDDIVIKVIRTGPGSVKLGIDAPKDIRVVRGELDEMLVQKYDSEGESADSETSHTEEVAVGSPKSVGDRNEDDDSVTATNKAPTTLAQYRRAKTVTCSV